MNAKDLCSRTMTANIKKHLSKKYTCALWNNKSISLGLSRVINSFLICYQACSVSPFLSITIYLFAESRWLFEINLRLAVFTEHKPKRVESSCVFPGDKGYFTSSEAIISRVRKARTDWAEVKLIYTGMMTAEKK